MGARAIRSGEKLMDDMRPPSWVHRIQPIVSQAEHAHEHEHEREGPLRAFDTTSVIFGPADASPLRAGVIGGPEAECPEGGNFEMLFRTCLAWYRFQGCHECMRPSSCLQVRATGRTACPALHFTLACCRLQTAVQSSHRATEPPSQSPGCLGCKRPFSILFLEAGTSLCSGPVSCNTGI
jgi:hypothetical protein